MIEALCPACGDNGPHLLITDNGPQDEGEETLEIYCRTCHKVFIELVAA